MKPGDLSPGDLIPTNLCGALTVLEVPHVDFDLDDQTWDRVYVDVQPADQGTRWDVADLPAAAGAEAATWLGVLPLRYRLTYIPTTEVEVHQWMSRPSSTPTWTGTGCGRTPAPSRSATSPTHRRTTPTNRCAPNTSMS